MKEGEGILREVGKKVFRYGAPVVLLPVAFFGGMACGTEAEEKSPVATQTKTPETPTTIPETPTPIPATQTTTPETPTPQITQSVAPEPSTPITVETLTPTPAEIEFPISPGDSSDRAAWEYIVEVVRENHYKGLVTESKDMIIRLAVQIPELPEIFLEFQVKNPDGVWEKDDRELFLAKREKIKDILVTNFHILSDDLCLIRWSVPPDSSLKLTEQGDRSQPCPDGYFNEK